MSHFVVVVLGEDIDGQLAPYDENAPGEEPELRYMEPREVQDMRDHYRKEEGRELSPSELLERVAGYWTGQDPVEDYEPFWDGSRIAYYSWYNHDAKWDWYQVGGRWRGFWMLKEGHPGFLGENSWTNEKVPPEEYAGRADYALKRDIDFYGMRAAAEKRAHEYYDKLERVIADSSLTQEQIKAFMPWDSFRQNFKNIDTARTKYREQPMVAVFAEAAKEDHSLMSWNEGPSDIILMGRDAYVERQSEGEDVPFAILQEGEWIGRGDMGWFGVVSDEKDKMSWVQQVHALYESLPEDTLMTAVDCHI